MKKMVLVLLLGMVMSGWAGDTGSAPGKHPVFATTIDFLDYAFYDDADGEKAYYPLEVYERRIRELADAGIGKIYLRVNSCGLTLYPTAHGAMYGADGAFHWNTPERSKRLINTLARYNPLTETIRLGKKYRMEVWCWENLSDEGGHPNSPAAEFSGFAEKFNNLPMLNPFYRAHPECQARIRPDLYLSAVERARINAAARKHPIARIEFTESVKTKKDIRIKPDELEIYVSSDNQLYRRYTGDFTFTPGRDASGFNGFVVSGLNITEPYIKLAHPDYADDRYSLTLRRPRGEARLVNTLGETVPSVWQTIYKGGLSKTKRGFDFRRFDQTAFDHKRNQIGCVVGEPEVSDEYFTGIAEFNVPLTMEHRLNKFAELAEYDFDGFMFNVRSHSSVANPENYGWNPEVLAKFRARYGREAAADDTAKIFHIRAEAIADFFFGCKQKSGGRPIWFSGLPASGASSSPRQERLGPLPWLYERYFNDRSIDGVVMIGEDSREELRPLIAGRNIRLGIFREMLHIHRDRVDFAAETARLAGDAELDEVELYEAMILSLNPGYLDALKKTLADATGTAPVR